MTPLWWIALALWVMVAQRMPWVRYWGWLTAKALALRSWVFDEGYQAAVIPAEDGAWVPSRYDEARLGAGYSALVREMCETLPPPPVGHSGVVQLDEAPPPCRTPRKNALAKRKKAKP